MWGRTTTLVALILLLQMKLSKKIVLPALLLGIITVGGATAYAAGPGIDVAALTGFTDAQKSAITEAFQIRKDANVKAKAVLDTADVDQSKLHDAMRSMHEGQRAKLDAALEANDYAAFKALVAGSPMADKLTADVFANMVKVHALEKAGDHAGAMKLRKDLGLKIGGMGMGEGRGGPHTEHGNDN